MATAAAALALASPVAAASTRSMPDLPPLAISPLRKAAILIMTLGEETSKLLLRELGEHEIQRLTEELSRVGDISAREQAAVLVEFFGLLERSSTSCAAVLTMPRGC